MFKQLTTNLQAASFGRGANKRILIFRTDGELWEKVSGGNIILVGTHTKKELRTLLSINSRAQLDHIIPGGISGRTLSNLRAFLGISKSRGRPRQDT